MNPGKYLISSIFKVLAVLFIMSLSETESIVEGIICVLFALAIFCFSSVLEGDK
jgi:hypothetical protein